MKPEDSQPEAENIEEMKEVEDDKVVFTYFNIAVFFRVSINVLCSTPNYMKII